MKKTSNKQGLGKNIMPTKVFTLIGAESTGKTTLARELAKIFQAPWIAEYARFYVENIHSQYDYQDVINIAKAQIWLWEQAISAQPPILFQDTDLIITKIWLQEVFGHYPKWIDEQIQRMLPAAYLFCETDLPWKPDKARENPGDRRNYLSNLYKNEILKLKAKMQIITGTGSQRLNNAAGFVNLATKSK